MPLIPGFARRRVTRVVFCVLLGASLVWLALWKDDRPNIILIMADDVSPDLFSCFDGLTPHQGKFSRPTPNIDEFAEHGVIFKTAYAAAMCLPSRVELLTGKYGTTTGVIKNRVYLDGNDRSVYSDHVTFTKVLKDAGYSTAIAGKWHAGRQHPHEEALGFDEYCLWESDDRVRRLTGQELDPAKVGWEGKRTPSRYWHPCLVRNGELLETKPEDFGPDLCLEFIFDFMERKASRRKPFFVYWPTVAPHETMTGGYPSTPESGRVGDMGSPTDSDRDERFAALVQYLDAKVGDLRLKLQELGIADNTLLVFCSDNGTWPEGKSLGVERGCHVVFMVEGAGTIRRGMTDELMDFTDVAPTLAEYAEAGVVQEVPFDGKSLRPFLRGESEQTKPIVMGFMSGSVTLRSKTHLLEAVNPILGVPVGRFYHTGGNRFWKGYERVDADQKHRPALLEFTEFLKIHPPIPTGHPFWKTEKGIEFLKIETAPIQADFHLYNPERYRFYDQSIPGRERIPAGGGNPLRGLTEE
jgi:arylsulfatase A